jgi:drug/metabolite transporter (DMT)-like permease
MSSLVPSTPRRLRVRFTLTRLDLALVAMAFIWGSNFTVIKAALLVMPEVGFNAIRMILASLLFVALLARGDGLRATLATLSRGDWIRLAALGLIGHTFYQWLFMAGVARTSVANSSLIFGCTPITVSILSALGGHERIGRVRWAGVLLSLAGVYLVVGQRAQGGASRFGDLLVVGAMFSWAVYTIGSRAMLTRHSPLVLTALTMAIGTAFYAPFGIPSLARMDWTAVPPIAWLGLLYSAVFALVVAYLIWYTAVQRVGSSHTSIYSNVVPLVAMVVAAVGLGEPLTAQKIIGAAAILGGVALTRMEVRKPGTPSALQ